MHFGICWVQPRVIMIAPSCHVGCSKYGDVDACKGSFLWRHFVTIDVVHVLEDLLHYEFMFWNFLQCRQVSDDLLKPWVCVVLTNVFAVLGHWAVTVEVAKKC